MATACGNCHREMSVTREHERAFRAHEARHDVAFCSPACEETYIGRLMARGNRPKPGTTYVLPDMGRAEGPEPA